MFLGFLAFRKNVKFCIWNSEILYIWVGSLQFEVPYNINGIRLYSKHLRIIIPNSLIMEIKVWNFVWTPRSSITLYHTSFLLSSKYEHNTPFIETSPPIYFLIFVFQVMVIFVLKSPQFSISFNDSSENWFFIRFSTLRIFHENGIKTEGEGTGRGSSYPYSNCVSVFNL